MEVWRLPQAQYVDAVRWLPPAAAWQHLLALALWDSDTGRCSIDIKALEHDDAPDHSPWLETQASWVQPARITALKVASLQTHQALLAAASLDGSLSLFLTDPMNPAAASPPLVYPSLHAGAVSGLDVQRDSQDCVTVGADGKINLVKVAQSQLQPRCMHDNHGVMSFSSARWASPVEFVTAGLRTGLQWWDQRRPGGAVSQSPAKRAGTDGMGRIHSIDVHPSRKHMCVVGGSDGGVFAWDLRWQQEPIALAGIAAAKGQSGSLVAEGEVWEVKFDPALQAVGQGTESAKVPPVLMCSEDGVLSLLEAGDAVELLAEACAINGFDVELDVGNDIICALEHESLLYLKRPS